VIQKPRPKQNRRVRPPWRTVGAASVLAVVALALLPTLAAAATSFPNDYFFANGDQWALTGATASINAPIAWCASTGAGVLVADIDTGADFGHPDLQGKLTAGAAFLNGDGSVSGTGQGAVQDGFGHGTMTTGIIAAQTNNGQGIAAVAPDARALIVKVLNNSGQGYDVDVAAGIRWAADNGARVINLSLGPEIPLLSATSVTSNIPAAIQYAYGKGVAIALAAGNSGLPIDQYLGGSALVVGALDSGANPTSYSNAASVYAPGGSGNSVQTSIVSTYIGGQYAYGNGTSFATPQVAGVLAQLMARGMSNGQAYNAITNSAVQRNGAPDLDAARALGASGTCGSPAATPTASSNATAPPAPGTSGGGSTAGPAGGKAHPSASPGAAGVAGTADPSTSPPSSQRSPISGVLSPQSTPDSPTTPVHPLVLVAVMLGVSGLVGGAVWARAFLLHH
jgi:subtilisin family serine protease